MKNSYLLAQDIIEKAAHLINRNLHKKYNKVLKISYKKGAFNLVTNVDKEVENFLVKKIKSTFSEHTIIAEESGLHNKNQKFKWFIDPIDGTTNFAHSYPCFCISIGFSVNDRLEFGLVKNPYTGELYTAQRGKGAKLNNKPIKVSKIKNLKNGLLATGFSYDRQRGRSNNFKYFKKLTLMTQGVRRDGAAAMDLCYVASGKLDGFWEFQLSPWDVAAGVLILKEAGGKITDFKGKEFDVFGKHIVATNGLIHKELIKQLK